jgi:hypothetical protein
VRYGNVWIGELKEPGTGIPACPAHRSSQDLSKYRWDYFRIADQPPGISVSLQVENKQFIGDGHLIGPSLR